MIITNKNEIMRNLMSYKTFFKENQPALQLEDEIHL